MKRTFVAVALAIVFVLALAAPAFALMHSATYEMDGLINFKKQAGHACNTGAEIKQTIMGSGVMSKAQTVNMGWGVISMQDSNDFVAGATPLTVTTVWELCTPAKHVYDIPGNYDAVAGVDFLFSGSARNTEAPGFVNGWNHPSDKMEDFGYTPISEQVWAVQVQADPGFSGNLKQNGTAAYGSSWSSGFYLGQYDLTWKEFSDIFGDWDENDLQYGWGRFRDALGNRVTLVGPGFVGDYFTMDQHARTSQGTVRRYIDISSWRDHGYLMEDMSVVGKSDIKDVFNMTNLKAGADVPGAWWKLF